MQIKSLYKPSVFWEMDAAEIFTKTCPTRLRGILLVMKLTTFLLLTALLQASAKSEAQTVTYVAESVSIENIFVVIKQQTGYVFFYRDEDIRGLPPVSVSFRNTPLGTALQETLKGQPLQYNVQGKTIFITTVNIRTRGADKQKEIISEDLAIEISGVVRDKNGAPLEGVSVTVKGTQMGTTTNANGRFQLSVPSVNNLELVFSFVGYATQTVKAGSRTEFNIVMEEAVADLSDVVVVGYGTQKKSDVTGAVASVPKERLEIVPNLNVAQALQGSVPGMIIQQTQGGAIPQQTIMVRGRNSILASNDPLVVVDGVPYGGDINDINLNDVVSIEVLKDASSAAIYGSRGANGVILITTKIGSNDRKARITLDSKIGSQKAINYPKFLGGPEFYAFKQQREPGTITSSEQKIFDNKEWVNWADLALRRGASQEHNLSVTGGNQKTSYFISGALLNIKGVAINDGYNRISARVNLETEITNWLKIGTRNQFVNGDRKGYPLDWELVFKTNPLTKAYDANGSLTLYPWDEFHDIHNPLEPINYDYTNRSNQIISNHCCPIKIGLKRAVFLCGKGLQP